MRNQQTERQGYHLPFPPLDELCGYASLQSFEQTQERKSEMQEKLFFFQVNLEISSSIPFIYDCIREQAPNWQALNASIEAMIELHKAYNHHIREQFKQLEKEILGGEDE
ncbi:hypothetical protein HS327_00606 [Glaesserella parasuis]|uniref:hypothetical protein n=1 Tax=Glaesserella parasuis TaxID=738 RepID=UPI0004DCE35E|nr:hypothetical protein [Glaesserella parasuis]ATW43516.1 hypothetical protein A2U20_06795 [Glaesserella parasuis D74]KEZ23265.1 hypothetical protein HS327_00606 [Glaesserella parasuis]